MRNIWGKERVFFIALRNLQVYIDKRANITNVHKLKSFSFVLIGWNIRKFTKNMEGMTKFA